MELSHGDGKLRVHYSDKLVSLLREVRQLAAFGFAVPAKIQHTASIAHKFYRHGVILKQVYHLHTKMCFYIACTVYSMYIHVNLCKLHFDIGPEEMSVTLHLHVYMYHVFMEISICHYLSCSYIILYMYYTCTCHCMTTF